MLFRSMHALKELGNNVEDAFVKIASTNPERTIFGDGGSHADIGEDKVESVSGTSEGKDTALRKASRGDFSFAISRN